VTVPGRKSPPIHRRPSRSGHLDQADSAEQAHGAPAPPSAYDLVVRLQREVGNKGVTGVLSGQVAPPPLYDPLGAAIAKTANQDLISVNERPDEVTLDPVKPVNPANAAVMPPATQAKVLAARATLSRIPKLDSSDLETLKRTTAPQAGLLVDHRPISARCDDRTGDALHGRDADELSLWKMRSHKRHN